MIPFEKRKVGECIFLSIITFGIYLLYWKCRLVIVTKAIKGEKNGTVKEMLCLILVPLYSIFWWMTRSKTINDKFKESGYAPTGEENIYLILSILGLDIVSVAVMQRDINVYLDEYASRALRDGPELCCTDLCLGYDGRVILENLNFSVKSGDYLCIVGENGSGKSTLMRTVLGLQSPLSGKVTFGAGLQKNQIGYLPQQTVVQKDFPASVKEIVLSGCCGGSGMSPFYTASQKARCNANIEKMGITHLSKRCYRELSGGQQQRVLLARALCATEKMLLLDEPVSGLDPKVTAEMYALIEKLNREDKITVIMISHDIAAAVKYATHILHIGKTVFFGTKEEYLGSREGRLFDAGERGEAQ